jgi:amino acid transporter
VKRQFAVHHDGATPDGRFCTAIHAFPPINRAQPTQSLRRALSAHKPVLLSHFFHVVNACRFIWKLFKEVFCCHNHHIFSKPQAPLRNLFMFYIQTDIHFKGLSFLAYLMIIAMLLVGIVGIADGNAQRDSITTLFEGFRNLDFSVFNLTALALWAFMAFEFVCPMVEETKNPDKNIPRSMIYAAVALLIVYSLIALAGYLVVPNEELANSEVPHYILVSSLFGETGKFILAVLAITATCSTINSVLATLPRMLFGMAHNKQVPSIFMKIHPRTQTPWVGITSMVILILVPYLIFKNAQDVVIVMIISAATVWLVAYIFGYINLLILRKKYPNFNRPFKSPFYPWAQIIGILAMVYMIFNNSPTPDMTFQVYMNAGILVLIASIYAGLWVKYKMKKGLFEPEPIDQALKN